MNAAVRKKKAKKNYVYICEAVSVSMRSPIFPVSPIRVVHLYEYKLHTGTTHEQRHCLRKVAASSTSLYKYKHSGKTHTQHCCETITHRCCVADDRLSAVYKKFLVRRADSFLFFWCVCLCRVATVFSCNQLTEQNGWHSSFLRSNQFYTRILFHSLKISYLFV